MQCAWLPGRRDGASSLHGAESEQVSGTRPGKTRRIAIGIGFATAVFCALAMLFRDAYPDGRVAIFCGVVMAIIAARGSVAWDRAWRAELREEMS
ncbi:hypothetical protein [Gemmatimonas sp.]|uniref:hypothetical protein n=1 Tax=Gemmatimonas sp. TaxID=1962908 RepID=UPI00286DE1E0|nr:hypothetical protein [Gemmatimonas sp.]